MNEIRIEACRLAVIMIGAGSASDKRMRDVITLVAFFEHLITEELPPEDAPPPYPTIANGSA